ncbi:MAG: DUF5615 family PIN-like protein [Devosia sp.]|nr:DUF5615 family PIN-like protein [Devosia sp.]
MTRFIVDAQLSRKLVRHLQRAGHSASHCFEHLDPSADDMAIAMLANRLGASVVSKMPTSRLLPGAACCGTRSSGFACRTSSMTSCWRRWTVSSPIS